MKKADAVAHYGSQQKLAKALKRAQSTVAEWPEAVPLDCAFMLERLTKKHRSPLKIDFSLYPENKIPDELRS